MDHRSPLVRSRTGHAGEGRMLARTARRVPLAVALVLLSAQAVAQAPAAEALFEQGRVALAAGDLETACSRFRASDQLEPGAGTRANLGDCEERRGRLASAWEAFRGALQKLDPGDDRVPKLQKRVAALEKKVPHLKIVLAPDAPAETTVREADAVVGTSATFGVALPFDPGVHHLKIEAPGRAARMVDVTLTAGEAATVTVQPGDAVAPAAPEVQKAPPSPLEPTKTEGPSRVGPIVLMAVGGAALVVGLGTGIVVMQDKGTTNAECLPRCSPTGAAAATQGRTLGPVTTTMLVVGSAALVGGGIWFGLTGTDKVAVGVAPATAGAVWRVEGSW